eukprot:CAMPEP_0174306124 /NCGR_PEP_ID=MMETSP0810-20121108/245_1 /TAXON_ID=73025 ORGANISM="Eutreptiella gymnastica-like, Strain CCMP1594" /NCGR_SAMPLE_ID=MMETSP0810 /ASSEMBLY_ACC=CAM_ASM_000659 /LENGTH=64 /DNA_ID=CAMNT_0015412741 /DNA_START=328 /DNA_END=523 /DNA_ORIENTATION=-
MPPSPTPQAHPVVQHWWLCSLVAVHTGGGDVLREVRSGGGDASLQVRTGGGDVWRAGAACVGHI